VNISEYRAARDRAAFLIREQHTADAYAYRYAAQLRNLHDQMKVAAAPEHKPSDRHVDFLGQVNCSCGWESYHYWTGSCFAYGEWYEHVAEAMGLVEVPV
jgi:hypothetical protein